MSEQNQIESRKIQIHDAVRSIPAARPLSDFAVEHIGEDLVIFDAETMQYHTLNETATWIWQSCNGVATTSQIARELDIPIEMVESTISELGEAGLLQSPSKYWDSTLSRRRASKLIAAGLVGAVGLPVIKSITAPDSASAFTVCPPGQCICCNSDGSDCSGCIGHGSCKAPKTCF